MLIVPQSISAPATFTVTFTAPYFGVDLTSVTAVAFKMLRKDGTSTTLQGTIIFSVPGELVVQYQFSGGEITSTGLYYLTPMLSVPGGQIPATSIALMVQANNLLAPVLEDSAWIAATSPVNGAPSKLTWNVVTPGVSPLLGLALSPWFACDLRTGNCSVQLWVANDGDNLFVSDAYVVAGANQVTLLAGTPQGFLPGGGSFLVPSSYPFRMKYSTALGGWVRW